MLTYLTQLKDEELVERLAAGETAAMEVLYDRYAKAVFSLVLRIVKARNIAEEITQEAFLRTWRHAGEYALSRGRVSSWLLGIAHNLAIDELRRQRSRPHLAEAASNDTPLPLDFADPSPDVEEATWIRLCGDAVKASLRELPEAQRKAIELAYFAGLTHVEIASALGEPLGTIKTRMRLGLKKLRDSLQQMGFEG